MNRRRLGHLRVSAASGQNGKHWEGLAAERLDTSAASEFGGALGNLSTRSGPAIAAAGRLRGAKTPHKMAQPAIPNFVARCRGVDIRRTFATLLGFCIFRFLFPVTPSDTINMCAGKKCFFLVYMSEQVGLRHICEKRT